MSTDARRQGVLIDELHLQNLFDSTHWAAMSGNTRPATCGTLIDRSRKYSSEHAGRLAELLCILGLEAAGETHGSSSQNAAATVRAAANIANWLTYLPHDCVKAMVNDGWHFST